MFPSLVLWKGPEETKQWESSCIGETLQKVGEGLQTPASAPGGKGNARGHGGQGGGGLHKSAAIPTEMCGSACRSLSPGLVSVE